VKMCVGRIQNATDLYCYKITYEDGSIVYYVDTSMSDAAASANEIMPPKSIEEIGAGAIGC
jgi:hypothetical protein